MKKLFDSTPKTAKPDTSIENNSMEIAIIGMAGRVGEAEDLDSFWNKILEGQNFLKDIPDQRRQDIVDYLNFSEIDTNNISFKQASFLDEIDSFDHGFFNISHTEATTMYPDQRLFLQNVWHALEDAGYAGAKIKGTRTGVYVGYAREENRYIDIIRAAEPELAGLALTGNVASIIAGRVAHFLDLKGPTMLVNTACSSSLVALHQACQALRNNDCEMAITGSAQIALLPVQSADVDMGTLGVESSNGLTRTFDDTSDGTGGGEGCIAFVLKPLEKAIQDDDRIHAVIKGSAINHDGSSLNIAAPNVAAQEEVIQAAWKNARVDPLSISYIEVHGTGTPIGDPIEIAGITAAFKGHTQKSQFCAVSAVKSNIGHLDAAAGAAGVAKAVLSLRHKTIAPTLHFGKPNKHINFETSPVFVNTRVTPWKNTQGPLRCGVSSFGVSGTNAHVVLEEAPQVRQSLENEQKDRLFVLSATNERSLQKLARKYVNKLAEATVNFGDLCYTVSVGRGHFSNRLTVLAESTSDLLQKLNAWLNDANTNESDCILEGEIPTLKSNVNTAQEIRKISEEVEVWLDQHIHMPLTNEGLRKLSEWYVKGADITWQTLFIKEKRNIISLPLYSFQAKRCWFEIPEKEEIGKQESQSSDSVSNLVASNQTQIESNGVATGEVQNLTKAEDSIVETATDIFDQFKSYFSESFEIPKEAIKQETNIYEIGLDSLSIVQVRQLIKKRYKVEIPIIDLFKKYVKIGDLSNFIASQLATRSKESRPETTQPKRALPQVGGASNLTEELSAIKNQLDGLIQRIPELPTGNSKKRYEYQPVSAQLAKPVHSVRVVKTDKDQIGPKQLAYIDLFATKYQKRTQGSLEHTLEHMPYFANNRNVSGFKKEFKKLQYTIIADAAKGSRIWDIDGNEYIDFAMGFGVFFMGHNHPVIRKSLEHQVSKGTWLGPLSKLPGEVAGLVSELTGVERVAFYNSGTEAVMVATRLARATTGRDKIVIFSGAYHGMYDGVLGQRSPYEEQYEVIPVANGILNSMVEDLHVLEYDDPNALSFIEDNAETIAAVLVEPVQSRRPDLQPFEFLKKLRKISTDQGICLVFDEIINGFRISAGGAQEYFGVRADIVTYGKVAGGGLPLGIVAGKAEYLDGIDGGIWDPMGDSLPKFDHRRTIVAGTFCHHPLAMASAKAMLVYIKSEGPKLYDRINEMTNQFVGRINHYFETENVPIRLHNFGSMFHFRSTVDLKFFFYHLVHKGIYVWEGATFFISTVHTEEEVNRFEEAIKETVVELRKGGMMGSNTKAIPSASESILPITDEQLKIWLKCQESSYASASLNEAVRFVFVGIPDEEALEQALAELFVRHESLRVRKVDPEGQYIPLKHSVPKIIKMQPVGETLEVRRASAESWIKLEVQKPFSLQNGMVKACLISDKTEGFIVVLIVHQIVADGYSLSLIQSEFQQLYLAKKSGESITLPPVSGFSDYLKTLDQHSETEYQKLLDFWLKDWEKPFDGAFLPDPFNRTTTPLQRKINFTLQDELFAKVKGVGISQRTTPFTVLLACYVLLVSKLTHRKDVLIGVPSIGQLLLDNPLLVGQCLQMLPLRTELNEVAFQDILEEIGNKFALLQEYRNFVATDIIEHASNQGKKCHVPEIHMVFNMDPAIKNGGPTSKVEELILNIEEGGLAKYDLFVNLIEVNGQLHLSFQYNTSLFGDEDIQYWAKTYVDMLSQVVDNLAVTHADVELPTIRTENVLTGSSNYASWAQLLGEQNETVIEGIAINGSSIDLDAIFSNARLLASHPRLYDQSVNRLLLYSDDVVETLTFVVGCELMNKNHVVLNDRHGVHELTKIGQEFDLVIKGQGFASIDGLEMLEFVETLKTSDELVCHNAKAFDKGALIKLNDRFEVLEYHVAEHYQNLIELAERLDFSDKSGLWLLPDQLSPEEILNWCWLSNRKRWDLHIGYQAPDTKTSSLPWIVCGERTTLTNLADREDCYELLIQNWVVITDQPISSIFIQHLPTNESVINLHVVTRTTIGAAYCFHFNTSYELKNHMQWISSGQPLYPFVFRIQDREGNALPPQTPGMLAIKNPKVDWMVTDYSASFESNGDFKLWSSKKDTFTYNRYTFNHDFILDTISEHPNVASATLLTKEANNEIGALDLSLSLRDAKDQQLSPLSFLKCFFNKELLPGAIHWPEKVEPLEKKKAYDENDAKLLLDCLHEVLGSSRITLEDNYLALGGSSIKAIHLTSLIGKKLGIAMSPAKLFQMSKLEEVLDTADLTETDIKPKVIPSKKSYYPLSHTQKRFWVVEQLETKIHTSNLVEARNIYGSIDERVYFKACLEVINRHESLRTLFVLEKETPVQKVIEIGKYELDYKYETWDQKDGYLNKVNELVAKEVLSPFDLKRAPLLRIRLIKISDNQFVTVLVTHHIIFDGWSFDVFMRDVIEAYKNLLQNRPAFVRPLPIQFKDYCLWQNELIGQQGLQLQEYWKNKYKQLPESLNLQPASNRPALKNQEAGMIQFILDAELTGSLVKIAQANGTSMFMMVQTTILALLHCYTKQTDICIGTPVADREDEDLQDQIGCLINTLAIRSSFNKNSSFLEVLHHVKQSTLEAFEHKLYPFDLILKDIQHQRDPSRNPLFDFGYTYHESQYLDEMPEVGDLGIRSELIAPEVHSVKTDVWFHTSLNNGHLGFVLLYDNLLFKEGFIHDFIEDYRFVARTLSIRPGIKLNELLIRFSAVTNKRMAQRQSARGLKQRSKLQRIKKAKPAIS